MSDRRFKKAQASIGNIERSRFNSLSHSIRTSLNVGELVPFYCQEVLPGDEFNLTTNLVGRMQTPVVPTMDNLYCEYFYFFVPNRLVWKNWKNLMGESTSAWVDDTIYRVPHFTLTNLGEVQKKSFLDYLGVRPLSSFGGANTPISVLPRRAYDLIWNEWFRDQNLQDPLLTYESLSIPDNVEKGRLSDSGEILRVNKTHDYFTSCLPAPQKGPSVYIPFDNMILPVVAGQFDNNGKNYDNERYAMNLRSPADWSPIEEEGLLGNNGSGNVGQQHGSFQSDVSTNLSNLWAISSNEDAIVGAPTINALRLAFQIQKIYEKDARSGSRYVEMIRSHFGVISPDARQQRPEFLGGGREIIGIQQQVATTAGENSESDINVLGSTGAYSYTQHSKHGYKYASTEHGLILGLMTLRYKHTYSQGVPRYLTRVDRFDFYDPALAHLGEQPVMVSELFINSNGLGVNDQVFGYNEAWADYRYNLNKATANMRPETGEIGLLWHYGDAYEDAPTLSESWIYEDGANVKRTLYTSTVDDFFCDIYLDIDAIRPMPLYSVPGLIDHF